MTLLRTLASVVALSACGASQATAPTTTTTTAPVAAPVTTASPDAWPPLIRCAAMAAINLADHGNNTANVSVAGSNAPPVSVTVRLGPETMYVGGAQGVATVACFAIQAGAARASVVGAVRDTLDAITAPQAH